MVQRRRGTSNSGGIEERSSSRCDAGSNTGQKNGDGGGDKSETEAETR